MADKAQTSPPPPSFTIDTTSSPLTPYPKRAGMSSPDRTVEKSEKDSMIEEKKEAKEKVNEEKAEDNREDEKDPVSAEKAAKHEQHDSTESFGVSEADVTSSEQLADEDDLEADDGYANSAFGGSEYSDTTSVTSSIVQGIVENGRRYQTKREGEYWGPSDEKQFLSMEAAHIVYMLLEHGRNNPLFLSPISDTAQNILDIGTGTGMWAKEVADMFPSALVQGIDLSPPPQEWVPPNCKFEVDDVLKTWDFPEKGSFDLIHLRDMHGSFSEEQSRLLYKQAYNNLAPGGWIEEVEPEIVARSDDGSLAPDSIMANWDTLFYPICEKMGKPIDTVNHFKRRIEEAGFINIHEKVYKVPNGDWVKNPVLKEAGIFCKTQLLEGMEGYVMFILTHFGEPTPWTPEEVQVYLAKMRQEVNTPGLRAYYVKKRVWAQKPFDGAPKAE